MAGSFRYAVLPGSGGRARDRLDASDLRPIGLPASPAGRKSDERPDANRTRTWSRCVTFRIGDDGEMRAPGGGLVPDLACLFQHGAGVVVDVDQAVVDRVGEHLDRDVAIRPGRGGVRVRPRPAGRPAGGPGPAPPPDSPAHRADPPLPAPFRGVP